MKKNRKLIKKNKPRLIPIEKIWKKFMNEDILLQLAPVIEYTTYEYYHNEHKPERRNINSDNPYEKGKCLNYYAGFGSLKPSYEPDISHLELLAHIGGGTCHFTSNIITEFLNIIYPEEEWYKLEGDKHSITISKDGLLIADALEKYQKRKTIEKILDVDGLNENQ